jgi:hypothetical protein
MSSRHLAATSDCHLAWIVSSTPASWCGVVFNVMRFTAIAKEGQRAIPVPLLHGQGNDGEGFSVEDRRSRC